MTVLHFQHALLPEGWRDDVRVRIVDACVAGIETGTAAASGDERHAIGLPGLANLHSHAFQRAMAGLAETRGPTADSFWTWRATMYRFALAMTPEDVEAVAGLLYCEMLEAGFTRVGEFHYLHHDRDGAPYANVAEMAERVAAAADSSGIGLTLLPVFYAHGGFGGLPPNDGQRRFICDLDRFARLMEGSAAAVAGLPGAAIGVAPHSLRAVTPEQLAHVAGMSGGPVHIHVAEQVREVEDCLAWSGARPVRWLLDHAPVDGRWCLIHATHMTDDECEALAKSGAVAGLCPITEASLGDGLFPARRFLDGGGRFGVGSDSNVEVSAAGELRLLEYGQRLSGRARNVLAGAAEPSTGRSLHTAALTGGRQALGERAGGLQKGGQADIVSLDGGHPSLAGRRGDQIIDGWVFSAGNAAVDCVWACGVKQVAGGRHRLRDQKRLACNAAMMRLLA